MLAIYFFRFSLTHAHLQQHLVIFLEFILALVYWHQALAVQIYVHTSLGSMVLALEYWHISLGTMALSQELFHQATHIDT